MSMPIVATIEVDLLDMAVLLRNPSSVTRWKCRSTTGPFHYLPSPSVLSCKNGERQLMISQYVGSAQREVRFERRHMTSVIAAHRRAINADLSLIFRWVSSMRHRLVTF